MSGCAGSGDGMYAVMDVFDLVKAGNEPDECEDNASTMRTPTGQEGPGRTRVAVADGATSGFDPAGWAKQLSRSFAPGHTPDGWWLSDLRPATIAVWYRLMQTRWHDQERGSAGLYAHRRYLETPAFATFIGLELIGLDSDRPRWTAMGIGDTVLFHVRGGRLVGHFPPLEPDGFGLRPDGISSDPEDLERMVHGTGLWNGELQLGDRLYVATDAVARWMLGVRRPPGHELWPELAGIDGPGKFMSIVRNARATGAMENDDSTLVRVLVAAQRPGRVAICLPRSSTGAMR